MDELRKTVKVSDCGNDAQVLTEFDVSEVLVPYYAELNFLNNLRHFQSVNEHPLRSPSNSFCLFCSIY